MKLKLTPKLAYFIGLWKGARIPKGIGIQGDAQLLEIFTQCALEQKLTPSGKVLRTAPNERGNGTAFFFHSAYRAYFEKVAKDQLEVFKYKNDYAANFLAGLFDSCGLVSDDGKAVVFLSRDELDEIMLLRMGFKAKRMGRNIAVMDKDKKFRGLFMKFTKRNLN